MVNTKSSWVVFVFTLLLLAANFVGDHSLRIFYFSYSTGTLLMQLVFWAIIIFSETLPDWQLRKIIWTTAFLNLAVALVAYCLLDFPIPEFWVKEDFGSSGGPTQPYIILMLTLAYFCSALGMINAARKWRSFFGRGWLIVRLLAVAMIGLLIDMAVLSPVLFYLSADNYMAFWKMLSLASVKMSLNFMAIPISFAVILYLQERANRVSFSS